MYFKICVKHMLENSLNVDWNFVNVVQKYFINVHRCGNIYSSFGNVQKLTFVLVNSSVMFTDFGHNHWVILIWSSE